MRISARNALEGTVKEVKKGATTSHVLIDVRGLTITSSITNEAVDELGSASCRRISPSSGANYTSAKAIFLATWVFRFRRANRTEGFSK